MQVVSWLLYDSEDIIDGHDHEFFAVELDFGSGVGGEDDFVAFFDFDGGAFAVIEAFAFADAEDLAAFGFFLGAVGQNDAGLGFGLCLDAFDEDFVTERTKLGHFGTPVKKFVYLERFL